MLKTLIGALALGVGGAPAMVAWCLTLCSPTHEAAAAPAAGHCALHAPGDAAAQVATRGMEGCATAHDAGYGLVDGKSPDNIRRPSAPALAQAAFDLAPDDCTRVRLTRITRPGAAPAGLTHTTPLRL